MRFTEQQKRDAMSPLEQKAADRTARANARYAQIDSDTRVTDLGKRQLKAREWVALRQDLDEMKAGEIRAAETRRQTLTRSLFGLPSSASANDVMAYRDATERASRIKDEAEAARAMSTARDVGDVQVVRAIAAQAVQSGWGRLIDAYVADIHPEAAPKVAELTRSELPLQNQLHHEGYFLAFNPPGLEGATEWQLRHDAADGDPNTSAPVIAPASARTLSVLGDLLRELDSQPTAGSFGDTDPLDAA